MVDTRMVHKAPAATLKSAQVIENIAGEGRCPVVPLVFKTSLGVVRSPEGSTPSLLRQARNQDFTRSTLPGADQSSGTIGPGHSSTRKASLDATLTWRYRCLGGRIVCNRQVIIRDQ